MNSERLLTIASFVEKNDTVLDVGCDHGYLDIYLKKIINVRKYMLVIFL